MRYGLLTPAALARIEDALTNPSSYAHREFGQDAASFRAKAVANALTYDDEELRNMGLGNLLSVEDRQRLAQETREMAPVDADAPLFRTPELDSSLSGVSYHNRPLWVDAPVALAAAIVASVALVLAVIALMM